VLPYFALIVLVAIIPACRWMESAGSVVDAEAGDRALAPAFKREMALPAGAIGSLALTLRSRRWPQLSS
jgi:hypothetical protein